MTEIPEHLRKRAEAARPSAEPGEPVVVEVNPTVVVRDREGLLESIIGKTFCYALRGPTREGGPQLHNGTFAIYDSFSVELTPPEYAQVVEIVGAWYGHE